MIDAIVAFPHDIWLMLRDISLSVWEILPVLGAALTAVAAVFVILYFSRNILSAIFSAIFLVMIALPFIGLYRTGWHKAVIIFALLIPLVVLIAFASRVYQSWDEYPYKSASAYFYVQNLYLPIFYHDDRPLPETLFGYDLPEEWQTYGGIKYGVGYSYYEGIKSVLSEELSHAVKLSLVVAAIGYIYGLLYVLLAAWAAWREK